MFGRREVKTHRRLMRDELGESLGHLRLAAAHAADGASGALAPRVESARKASKSGLIKAGGAAGTMLVATKKSTLKAGKKAEQKLSRKKTNQRRWPMAIGGLVLAGAAIGAASALIKRRKTNDAWDEYGSTRTTSDTGSVLDSAKNTMDAGIDKAKTMGEAAKDRASDLIGSKSTNTGPAGSGDYDKHPMPQSASKNSRS